MNSQPQSIDTNHSGMERHPSKFTDPKFRFSNVASSVPRLPGSNRQTSQPYPGYVAPILATAGKATSTRFVSLCRSGTTGDNTESPSSPSLLAFDRIVEPVGSITEDVTSIWGPFLQQDEEQQSLDSGKQSSCQSYDANHSRMELHPSKFSGPEVRYDTARPALHPPDPNRQTSQPYPEYMVPTFRTAGETLPNHFMSLSSSGTTGDNNTESPSSSSPATTNVQPVEPSSITSIWGRRFLQWDEEQQSIDSGKQGSCHSYDANHSNMELHPSKFISPEVRYTIARSVPRPPGPNMQSSEPGYTAPTFRTAGETLLNHFIPLSGSGTTGDITTESSSSPSPATTNVQPVRPSSGTSTLRVIRLPDTELICRLNGCRRTFSASQSSSHLSDHHALVLKDDSAACPLCAKPENKVITNFLRHFQVEHYGVRRYKCSRCPYASFRVDNLKRHIRKMGGKSKCGKD